MPRGDNFRGKKGPGRPLGVPNRSTREVREAAQCLVNDPEYQTNLLERLRAGKAGAIEPLI